MKLVLAAAAALLPLSSSAAEPQPDPIARVSPVPGEEICEKGAILHVRSQTKPEFKTLEELPPGDLILAVHREIDGCFEPVIVRHDIGGQAPSQELEDSPHSPQGRGLFQPL